jgi:hypothetical protein
MEKITIIAEMALRKKSVFIPFSFRREPFHER